MAKKKQDELKKNNPQNNEGQNHHALESETTDAADSAGTHKTSRAENASKDGQSTPAVAPKKRNAQPGSTKNDQSVATLLVGIGASAGGLDPLFDIMGDLESDSPCAYFVVQHQAMQTDDELLTSLLGKRTECEVQLAEDETQIKPGVLYVAPPAKLIGVEHGRIRLEDRQNRTMPIDYMLRSLAREAGEGSMAVLLSGSDTDGTLGARDVMEAGGIIIAQDPDTAEYATMPKSVIDSGYADIVVPPLEIPEELRNVVLRRAGRKSTATSPRYPDGVRTKLLEEVKNQTGHDFSTYKDNTINRRIQRRLDFHKFDTPNKYLKYIKSEPDEAHKLFKDMLISVTNFFRDPLCFEALKKALVNEYLPQKKSTEFRAWVPGCASGEEAYSLAIILAEAMSEADVHCEVNIYATDVDSEAIAKARIGVFPENIEADVSEKRLRRYFINRDGTYRVNQKIRDMLIFAEQNVRQDPPFYRLDAIICRNLLMYFKPDAQRQVLSHFCYALKQNGLLMLGTSENIGPHENQLRALDSHCRIYMAKRGLQDAHRNGTVLSASSYYQPKTFSDSDKAGQPSPREGSGIQSMERLILNLAAPTSVIVNRLGEIYFIHGRTGNLLEPVQGKPDSNVLRMAREGLRVELATMLSECASSRKERVRRNVRVRSNGNEKFYDIFIRPVNTQEFETPIFMISFQESAEPQRDIADIVGMDGLSNEAKKRIFTLESEVHDCHENIRIMTEEFEAANEELTSSNEELQSTNEELKSTVEELETAKEEVQSINEEQATLNDELQSKNVELQHLSSDLDNLLVSTDIATLFLNSELEIKRYTPSMTELMNVRESDIGRPVTDIAFKLDYGDLAKDADRAQDTLETISRELKGTDNSWLQMRIRPYKTTDNRIDGVVITFNDITRLKQSEQTAQSAKQLAESIIEIATEPLLVLAEDMTIRTVNRAFLDTFGVTEKRTLGTSITDVAHGRLDVPELKNALTSLVQEKEILRDYPLELEIEPSRRMRVLINAKYVPFSTQEGEAPLILLSITHMETLKNE